MNRYSHQSYGKNTLKDKLEIRKRRNREKGENWKREIMRRKSLYVSISLDMEQLEETDDSHLKNLLMPILTLMTTKDQRIIKIMMRIISIMVKEMMIRVERRVCSFAARMRF